MPVSLPISVASFARSAFASAFGFVLIVTPFVASAHRLNAQRRRVDWNARAAQR
jgi:fumarate reductase subunit D